MIYEFGGIVVVRSIPGLGSTDSEETAKNIAVLFLKNENKKKKSILVG